MKLAIKLFVKWLNFNNKHGTSFSNSSYWPLVCPFTCKSSVLSKSHRREGKVSSHFVAAYLQLKMLSVRNPSTVSSLPLFTLSCDFTVLTVAIIIRDQFMQMNSQCSRNENWAVFLAWLLHSSTIRLHLSSHQLKDTIEPPLTDDVFWRPLLDNNNNYTEASFMVCYLLLSCE